MGAWGNAAWEDDLAADWFGELFDKTKLAHRVEKTLNRKDLEEYAPEIRAAAHVLIALGRNYIWPIDDLDRHLQLAIAKLEAIRELPDYEGMTEIEEEIAILRSRLQKPEQDAAPTLVTPPAALKALADATHTDAAVRLKALRWIGNQARGETSNLVESWLANQNATGVIIRALDDPDPAVAEEAVIALMHTAWRYFRDPRGYPGVVRLLQSKRLLTRQCAVRAAVLLDSEASVNDVLPLLGDKAAKVRYAVLHALGAAVFDSEGEAKLLSAESQEKLCAAVPPLLGDKDQEVRDAAANLLGWIGDKGVLEHLKRAHAKERNAITKEGLQLAIDRIKKRTR